MNAKCIFETKDLNYDCVFASNWSLFQECEKAGMLDDILMPLLKTIVPTTPDEDNMQIPWIVKKKKHRLQLTALFQRRDGGKPFVQEIKHTILDPAKTYKDPRNNKTFEMFFLV